MRSGNIDPELELVPLVVSPERLCAARKNQVIELKLVASVANTAFFW